MGWAIPNAMLNDYITKKIVLKNSKTRSFVEKKVNGQWNKSYFTLYKYPSQAGFEDGVKFVAVDMNFIRKIQELGAENLTQDWILENVDPNGGSDEEISLDEYVDDILIDLQDSLLNYTILPNSFKVMIILPPYSSLTQFLSYPKGAPSSPNAPTLTGGALAALISAMDKADERRRNVNVEVTIPDENSSDEPQEETPDETPTTPEPETPADKFDVDIHQDSGTDDPDDLNSGYDTPPEPPVEEPQTEEPSEEPTEEEPSEPEPEEEPTPEPEPEPEPETPTEDPQEDETSSGENSDAPTFEDTPSEEPSDETPHNEEPIDDTPRDENGDYLVEYYTNMINDQFGTTPTRGETAGCETWTKNHQIASIYRLCDYIWDEYDLDVMQDYCDVWLAYTNNNTDPGIFVFDTETDKWYYTYWGCYYQLLQLEQNRVANESVTDEQREEADAADLMGGATVNDEEDDPYATSAEENSEEEETTEDEEHPRDGSDVKGKDEPMTIALEDDDPYAMNPADYEEDENYDPDYNPYLDPNSPLYIGKK